MNKLTQKSKTTLPEQKISITQTITLYSKTMKNEGKAVHLFKGTQQYLDLLRPLWTINHNAIRLSEINQKILHLGTNDVPCKSGTNTLKDLIELKGFILETLRSRKKVKLLLTTIRTDKSEKKYALETSAKSYNCSNKHQRDTKQISNISITSNFSRRYSNDFRNNFHFQHSRLIGSLGLTNTIKTPMVVGF